MYDIIDDVMSMFLDDCAVSKSYVLFIDDWYHVLWDTDTARLSTLWTSWNCFCICHFAWFCSIPHGFYQLFLHWMQINLLYLTVFFYLLHPLSLFQYSRITSFFDNLPVSVSVLCMYITQFLADFPSYFCIGCKLNLSIQWSFYIYSAPFWSFHFASYALPCLW